MNTNEILTRFDNAVKTNSGYSVRCPAHDDSKNSLSISQGSEGKTLVHCQAGCDLDAVLSAVELKKADLFVTKQEKRLVAEYKYTDVAGNVVHVTQRYEPKTFKQYQIKNGQKVFDLKGVQTVLYNLPDVVKAIQEGRPVFIVEGEKDCENMAKLGFTATTAAMGVNKWLPYYSDYLTGADIVILPDNDLPGKQHGEKVAISLCGKAKNVKIVNLPDVPDKGDVSDFIKKHGQHMAKLLIQKLVNETSDYIIQEQKSFKNTELGLAERLVYKHGKNLRFCYDWQKWLIWNGKNWEVDDSGIIERLAKDTIKSLYAEAASEPDEERRTSLAKFAARSETNRTITNMIELAKSEPGIPVKASELDRDKFQLNCNNGTLNLKTGILEAHKRENLNTKLINIDYNPLATCPVFESTLSKIMQGNENLISFIQRAAGYSTTGVTTEQVIFILYGPGGNGKSTFIKHIEDLLGEYARNTSFTTFESKEFSSGINNDIARLQGARLVTASETEKGKRLAESLIKQLTGGEKVTARYLRCEFFEFEPQFKIWLSTNHKPQIRGGDYAIWRRIRLIPFDVKITDADKDPLIDEKIKNEYPGILAWLVRGCLEWQRTGLGTPAEVIQATKEYEAESDILADFLENECRTDTKLDIKSAELYEAFKKYLDKSGERSISNKEFSQIMAERGFKKDRSQYGMYWIGITLNEK